MLLAVTIDIDILEYPTLRSLALVPFTLAWCLAVPALAATAAENGAATAAENGAATAAENGTSEVAPGTAPQGSAPATTETNEDKSEIVVIADRIKGQVSTPQPPVAVFNEEDIAAYGVSSITDLLTAISPQTSSGRGRSSGGMPVILIGGQRISSFREMRDFPPEAIRRVEVLPEETALRLGYTPDQRVVNFILKDKYRSYTGEIEYAAPDAGGAGTVKGQASIFRIAKGKRINLTARADHTTAITEAERGLASTVPTLATDPQPAQYRTLQSDSKNYSLNGTLTVPFGSVSSGSLTVNGTVSRADTQGLSGLNTYNNGGVLRTFDGPLTTANRTDTYQAGAALNKPLGEWQLAATLDATHAESTSTNANRVTDNAALAAAAAANSPLPSAGLTVSQTNTDSASTLLTMIGRPLQLPAGALALTAKAGFAYSALRGSTAGSPVAVPSSSLKRGDASVGINLGIPLTSTRDNVLAAVGDVTANLSAGADHLSDFGWLNNWSGGLTWNFTKKFSLQGSYVYSEAAPSLANLGSPLVANFNVLTYDFTKGQSTLATIITGGNPALLRERRNDIKLGMNWTPPILKGAANLLVEYFNNRSNNVTSSFPSVLTPALELAYPGRVTRDGAGNIVSVDRRAINLAEQREERIRWGLNIGGTIGKASAGGMGGMFGGPRPAGSFGPPAGGARPAGGPPAGGPPPGGMFGGNGQGRWNLSVYHTVQFVDRVLVAPGGPVLNLLGGDALSGGGVARHSLEMEGGGFYKGIGLRLNGNWTAPTRVESTSAANNDLRFGALFKLNTRLFFDLGQQAKLVKSAPFFKGARLSIYANNVLDQRQKVTNAAGVTPTNYLPAYLDPNGRIIGVEFRKMF